MPGDILIKVRAGKARPFGHFGGFEGHATHEGRVIARFNPDKHPRDRHGRFVEVGGDVRLRDGSAGKVITDLGGGYVEVRQADGGTVAVPAKTLEVIQAPAASHLAGHAVAARNLAVQVRASRAHEHRQDVQQAVAHLEAAAAHFDAGRAGEGAAELDAADKLRYDSSTTGDEHVRYAARQVRAAATRPGAGPVHDPLHAKAAVQARALAAKVRGAHGEHAEEAARKLDEAAAHLDAGMEKDATRALGDAGQALHRHAEAKRDFQLTGVASGREYGNPEAVAAARALTLEAGRIHEGVRDNALMRDATPGQRAHLAGVYALQAGGDAGARLDEAADHLDAGRNDQAIAALAAARDALAGTDLTGKVTLLHDTTAAKLGSDTPPADLPPEPPAPDQADAPAYARDFRHPGTAAADAAFRQAKQEEDFDGAVRHLKKMDRLEGQAGAGPDEGLRPKILGTINAMKATKRDRQRQFRELPKQREREAGKIAVTARQVITAPTPYTRATPEQAGQVQASLTAAAESLHSGDHEGALRHLAAAKEAAHGPAGTMVMTSGPEGRGAVYRIDSHEQEVRRLAGEAQALAKFAPPVKPAPDTPPEPPIPGPDDAAFLIRLRIDQIGERLQHHKRPGAGAVAAVAALREEVQSPAFDPDAPATPTLQARMVALEQAIQAGKHDGQLASFATSLRDEINTLGYREDQPPPPGGHTPDAPEPERPQDLASLKLPRNRKLVVLHGPDNTSVTGYTQNGDGELVIRRTRGGEITQYIPHSDVNVIGETAGHAGQANPVSWRRPDTRIDSTPAPHLREGQTVMAPHPMTGRPEPGTIIERSDHGDTVRLTLRRADGHTDVYNVDRSMRVDRVTAGVVPEDFPDEAATDLPEPPPPLIPQPPPAGVLIARPPLYTYQRAKIVALGLDADKSNPRAVRQAAAMIRLRLPLTAEQSSALAGAIEAHANSDGLRPVQARSLGRVAWRLRASAAEVRGSAPPELPPGRTGAVATAARGLTEGDSAALVGHDGTVHLVTVRGIKATMGGRILTMDLEHDNGDRETRTVTGRTTAWLLPDRPDDTPVPPSGPRNEHILPNRLRIGDTVRIPNGQELTVTGIQPQGPFTASIQMSGPNGTNALDIRAKSYDGGPVIIRTGRGPASQDQPWDQVMPGEHPEQGVLPASIRAGDRISVRTWNSELLTGEVQSVEPVITKGSEDGVSVTLREDNGPTTDVRLFDDTADRVTRLIKADGNAAARIDAERQARESLLRAATIRGALEEVIATQRQADLNILNANIGSPHSEVREALTQFPIEDLFLHNAAISGLARELAPFTHGDVSSGDTLAANTAAETMAIDRIKPAILQIAQRNRDNLVDSLDYATAGLSGDAATAAHRRIAGQFADTPPPVDVGQVSQALATAATAIRQAGGLTVTPQPDVPPALPADADLAARIAAYKAALPAPAQIGHREVQRAMFAATTLADLEAGRAPAVQMAHIPVPDRAEDSGPGHLAMRHLDIVMAAGRDMDAALQEHMAKVGGLTPEREAAAQAAQDRIRQISREQVALSGRLTHAQEDAQDEHAQSEGFGNFTDLLESMGETRGPYATDADDTEWYRLREIREAARTAGREAFEAIGQQKEKLAGERDQLRANVEISDRERADARRAAALAVLGKVRPDGLGGVKLTYQQAKAGKDTWPLLTERSELVKAMRWAEQHYPTSWLAGTHAHGYRMADGSTGGVYRLGAVARGQYTDGNRTIELSKGVEQVTGGGVYDAVSVHELGHAMERGVPGLTALEDAYLWSRTSSGEVGSRKRAPVEHLGAGHKPDEAAYRSDFPLKYTGKEYGRGGMISPAYEVFTTAAESLFAGSTYLDDGLRQWVLGTLATL